MIPGCTPYAEDEVNVVTNDPQDYADWCSEFEDQLNDKD